VVNFSTFIDILGATVGLIDMLALCVDIFNNIRHIYYCDDSSVEPLCLPECLLDPKQGKNEYPENVRKPLINKMERVNGIEPSFEAWEAPVLPLNYTRETAADPGLYG
jgi:hypothetical protein